MPLKFKVDSIDDLDDNLKDLYEQKDDSYVLKVEGIPDNNEELDKLRNSVSALESKNQEILSERAKTKKAAEQAALDAAKKTGDIESLEKSWADKLEKIKSEKDEKISMYEKNIYDLLVKKEANSLANKLALKGSEDVLLPHIEKRLTIDNSSGNPNVRVLDKNGELSALTLSDLEKEISDNPSFSPIIQGSNASGSGHNPTNNFKSGNLKRSKMGAIEKNEYIKQFGRDAYLKLPK